MGVSYLWDTNIAIYYLQQLFPTNAEQYIDGVVQLSAPSISFITEIELMCWKAATRKDQNVLKKFIDSSIIFDIEQGIKVQTAAIRKSHKIKLPDAIIAATAITKNLTLLSRNVEDFDKIKGLKLINPFDQ